MGGHECADRIDAAMEREIDRKVNAFLTKPKEEQNLAQFLNSLFPRIDVSVYEDLKREGRQIKFELFVSDLELMSSRPNEEMRRLIFEIADRFGEFQIVRIEQELLTARRKLEKLQYGNSLLRNALKIVMEGDGT